MNTKGSSKDSKERRTENEYDPSPLDGSVDPSSRMNNGQEEKIRRVVAVCVWLLLTHVNHEEDFESAEFLLRTIAKELDLVQSQWGDYSPSDNAFYVALASGEVGEETISGLADQVSVQLGHPVISSDLDEVFFKEEIENLLDDFPFN